MLETIFVPGAVIPNAMRFMQGCETVRDTNVRQFATKNTDSVIFPLGGTRGQSFYPAWYVPWIQGRINICEVRQSDGISSRFSGCRFVKFNWHQATGGPKTYIGHVHQGVAPCCKRAWQEITWHPDYTILADFRPADILEDDGLKQELVDHQARLSGSWSVLGIITKDNRCFSVAGVSAAVNGENGNRSFHVLRLYQFHSSGLVEVMT